MDAVLKRELEKKAKAIAKRKAKSVKAGKKLTKKSAGRY